MVVKFCCFLFPFTYSTSFHVQHLPNLVVTLSSSTFTMILHIPIRGRFCAVSLLLFYSSLQRPSCNSTCFCLCVFSDSSVFFAIDCVIDTRAHVCALFVTWTVKFSWTHVIETCSLPLPCVHLHIYVFVFTIIDMHFLDRYGR